MSQHGIEQFVIAEAVFCQAELFVRFGIFAQQVAADAHIRNQLLPAHRVTAAFQIEV
jgi:hypothetical protein